MALKNFTVLYVEDDKTLRDSMILLLESEVKKLYVATDGKEGFELYKELMPDIVITDIMMPNLNGFDMLEQIKKINKEQSIAIISAFGDVEHLKKAIELGIDKYILKPIDENNLFNTLNTIAQNLQLKIDNKRYETELQQQLQIKSMVKMLNNITHQWRQPLSVITMIVSTLKYNINSYGSISNNDLIASCNTILEETNQLSDILKNFNDNYYDATNYKEYFNVKEVIDSFCTQLTKKIENDYIKLLLDIDDVSIYNDKNQLINVISNIIDNSIDAFKTNNIENEDRFIFINIKNINEKLEIMIQDTAGGIPKSIVDDIFNPYFTTKHQNLETGNGLYFTYDLVTKILEGEISAQNKQIEYNKKTLNGFEVKVNLKV